MIAEYNRYQILKGVFSLIAGLVCYWLAWLFFRYGLAMVFHGFGFSPDFILWISITALGVITWSGYRHWQNGDGFKTFVESSLFHDLGEDSGGAVMVDHYARQLTGPAYVLSQIFLGGPLFLLGARKHFKQRLPNEAGLEVKLHQALGILRSANKWQAMTEYPNLRLEILMLAQMKQIDFSAHKGLPRIKASLPDGT